MKIAIAVREDNTIFKGHFGSAPKYLIFNEAGSLLEEIENPHDPKKTKVHHDNPQLIKELLIDVNVYIGRNFGEESRQKLVKKFNIVPFGTKANEPSEAIKEFITNG